MKICTGLRFNEVIKPAVLVGIVLSCPACQNSASDDGWEMKNSPAMSSTNFKLQGTPSTPAYVPSTSTSSIGMSASASETAELYEGLKVPVPGQSTDDDYVMKSDIYWKMNWVKKQLDSARVPPQLGEIVSKLRLQTAKSLDDDKKPLLFEICDLLEKGLDADTSAKELKKFGIELDQSHLYTEPKSDSSAVYDPIAPNTHDGILETDSHARKRRAAERTARKLTGSGSESPEFTKRMAFNEACRKIDQLAEMLGLQGRPENLKPGEMPKVGPGGKPLVGSSF